MQRVGYWFILDTVASEVFSRVGANHIAAISCVAPIWQKRRGVCVCVWRGVWAGLEISLL